MTQPAPISRRLGVTLLLLVATSFGGNHIAARIAFDHGANVTTAVAVRSAGTAFMLWLLLSVNSVPFALPRPLLRRALAAGLVLAVQSYCLYSAVARIPVALALLAFNIFPLMLSLISWAAGGERPSRATWLAMPVALAGLALALDAGGWTGAGGAGFAGRWSEIGVGVCFALAAAACFATVLFLNEHWLKSVDGRLRTFLIMTVVAATMIAGGSAAGDFAFPADAPGWIGLALLTLLYGTAITSVFVLMPRLGAVNNAMVLNFEPIAALLLAWMILGQSVAPLQIFGALVVVGAIVALGRAR